MAEVEKARFIKPREHLSEFYMIPCTLKIKRHLFHSKHQGNMYISQKHKHLPMPKPSKKKKNQSTASGNQLAFPMKIKLGGMCYDPSQLSASLNLSFREIYLWGKKSFSEGGCLALSW